MSLFSFFGPSIKYSRDKRQVTTEQIKRLMQNTHSANINQSNEQMVSEAVLAKRDSDDKISLQNIYEALTKLKNEGHITKIDRDIFMKIFVGFFNQ